MFNSSAIILGGIFIGLGIAASGALTELEKQTVHSEVQSACWDRSVTTGLGQLATQEAMPLLKSSFPDDMPQLDQDAVTNSFSIQLSDYAYLEDTDDGGTIHCNASSSFSYTRADGTVSTNDEGNVVSYEVHPASGGWSAEMSSEDIPQNVFNYVAPPAPTSPPAPVAAIPAPAQPSSTLPVQVPPEVADYDQGHTDRMNWENWVNGLQGPEKQGAIFWSSQRSLPNPEDCTVGASDTSQVNATDEAAFLNGCQEAVARLTTSDSKRRSDPLYKAGWNAPVPSDTSADGSAPTE